MNVLLTLDGVDGFNYWLRLLNRESEDWKVVFIKNLKRWTNDTLYTSEEQLMAELFIDYVEATENIS